MPEVFAEEKQVRQCCDECGSRELRWGFLAAIAFDCDGQQRRHVIEALDHFGAKAPTWLCDRCGNMGIFGPWETSR